MRKRLLCASAVAMFMTMAPLSARAQDPLEETAKKAKITEADRAKIQTQVKSRIEKLVDAGKDGDQRQAARERLLAPSRIKGAGKEFLDIYAELCAEGLKSYAPSEVMETGFDAVLVMAELNNPIAATALAVGLKSIHPATRMLAVRGILSLRKTLVADEKTAKSVLRILGEAGAEETQPLVLRLVYQAIDVSQEVKSELLADDAAKALNAVLAGRLSRLALGARDEADDEPGILAAGRLYPGASESQRRLLIGHLFKLLCRSVDRYYAADTADSYKPVLVATAKKIEDAVLEMIKASKARVPGKTVAEAMKKGGRDRQSADAACRELQAILKGDPWKLP